MALMFKLLGAIAAMASPIPSEDADRARFPIYLVAEPAAGGARFQVIGESEASYAATFSLEVEAGGNLSRHLGSATLRGGKPVTLSSVTIGLRPTARWRARLRVEPEFADAYEQVRTSE